MRSMFFYYTIPLLFFMIRPLTFLFSHVHARLLLLCIFHAKPSHQGLAAHLQLTRSARQKTPPESRGV